MMAEVVIHGADSYGNAFYYYDGGISYYQIMVKHNDTDEAVNELGEFGMVRNSVYDITITAINNPGYPVVPKPDEETPDEEVARFLSVEIKINPWTWYTQSVEL